MAQVEKAQMLVWSAHTHLFWKTKLFTCTVAFCPHVNSFMLKNQALKKYSQCDHFQKLHVHSCLDRDYRDYVLQHQRCVSLSPLLTSDWTTCYCL